MTDKKDTEQEVFDRLKYTVEEKFIIEIETYLGNLQKILKELSDGERSGTQGPIRKPNND
jgi:hypothetical protein